MNKLQYNRSYSNKDQIEQIPHKQFAKKKKIQLYIEQIQEYNKEKSL